MSSYSKESLINVIISSISLAEVLRKLNVIPAGGNYRILHKNIKQWNIDISHFKGQGWLRVKTHSFKPSIPLEEIFSGKHPHYQTFKLHKRLLKENVFEHRCSHCKETEWLGDIIPLELDHIDGNTFNHSKDNLRFLCPNCHTLTSTYRGKNKKH